MIIARVSFEHIVSAEKFDRDILTEALTAAGFDLSRPFYSREDCIVRYIEYSQEEPAGKAGRLLAARGRVEGVEHER